MGKKKETMDLREYKKIASQRKIATYGDVDIYRHGDGYVALTKPGANNKDAIVVSKADDIGGITAAAADWDKKVSTK